MVGQETVNKPFFFFWLNLFSFFLPGLTHPPRSIELKSKSTIFRPVNFRHLGSLAHQFQSAVSAQRDNVNIDKVFRTDENDPVSPFLIQFLNPLNRNRSCPYFSVPWKTNISVWLCPWPILTTIPTKLPVLVNTCRFLSRTTWNKVNIWAMPQNRKSECFCDVLLSMLTSL